MHRRYDLDPPLGRERTRQPEHLRPVGLTGREVAERALRLASSPTRSVQPNTDQFCPGQHRDLFGLIRPCPESRIGRARWSSRATPDPWQPAGFEPFPRAISPMPYRTPRTHALNASRSASIRPPCRPGRNAPRPRCRTRGRGPSSDGPRSSPIRPRARSGAVPVLGPVGVGQARDPAPAGSAREPPRLAEDEPRARRLVSPVLGREGASGTRFRPSDPTASVGQTEVPEADPQLAHQLGQFGTGTGHLAERFVVQGQQPMGSGARAMP